MTTGHNAVDKFIREKAEELGIPPSLILTDKVSIPKPGGLTGVRAAAKLVAKVIVRDNTIIFVNGDSDADGATSIAINVSMLEAFGVPRSRIIILQNEKKFGNGFNETTLESIKDYIKEGVKPGILITSDHGSSDEPRYKKLKAYAPELKIIVTDHHLFKDGGPKSVDGFINPQQCEEDLPYKNLSGGAVIWFLMREVQRLLEANDYPVDEEAIRNVLPMVALTTVVDRMSMLDPVNREIVRQGVDVMNSTKDFRYAVLKTAIKVKRFTDRDLAYRIGPIINACGRMNAAYIASNFLLPPISRKQSTILLGYAQNLRSQSSPIIIKYAKEAIARIKKKILKRDEIIVEHIITKQSLGGMTGPIASSISNEFSRTTIVLFDVSKDVVSGSARAMVGYDISATLQKVHAACPNILIKFGGHAGAAGLTMHRDKVELFTKLVNKFIVKKEEKVSRLNVIEVDESELNPELVLAISMMAPFGQNWEEPLIKFRTKVVKRFVTKDRSSAMYTFQPSSNGTLLSGFHYNGGSTGNGFYDVYVTGSIKWMNTKYGGKIDTFINKIERANKKLTF